MIFYVALDTNARHQLKTNQADAKEVNKHFEQIDIPIDKPGLQGFVQDLLDKVDDLTGQNNSLKFDATIAPATILVDPALLAGPSTPVVQPKAVSIQVPLNTQTIMEWLLDTASQAQVEQVFSAIGARWSEAQS